MESSIEEHIKPGTNFDEFCEIERILETVLPEEFPENPGQYQERLKESIRRYMKPGTTVKDCYELRDYLRQLPEVEVSDYYYREMMKPRDSNHAPKISSEQAVQERVRESRRAYNDNIPNIGSQWRGLL